MSDGYFSRSASFQTMAESDSEDSLFAIESDEDEKAASGGASPLSRSHRPHPPPDLHLCPVSLDSKPPVQGLYLFPALIPQDTANHLLREIIESNIFLSGSRNQAMLFTSGSGSSSSSSTLPSYITSLISHLEQSLLPPALPQHIHSLLFDPLYQSQPFPEPCSSLTSSDEPRDDQGKVEDPDLLARQVILNLYTPGQGITPHIDLPHRFADGILGVSLGWGRGCAMDFTRPSKADEGVEQKKHSVWVGNRSVYVMTGESRWEWAHGIEAREWDLLRDEESGRVEMVQRDVRVSITLRWLKPGANVLSVPDDRVDPTP